MEKYSTKQAAGAQKIETLGGDYALKWDDETQMSVNAHAVVEGNVHARHLYERLGFMQLGTIRNGFRMKDGSFANICPYY